MASIYLAREEVLSKSDEAKKSVERAVQEAQSVPDSDIKQVFQNALGALTSTRTIETLADGRATPRLPA